ncbi:hypothetical protein D3C84_764090 [compost metagenome]
MGGASLPNIPKIALPEFYSALSQMKLVAGNTFSDNIWTLENKGNSYLFYIKNEKEVAIDLSAYKGDFEVYAINAATGTFTNKANIKGGKSISIPASEIKEKVLFIIRK